MVKIDWRTFTVVEIDKKVVFMKVLQTGDSSHDWLTLTKIREHFYLSNLESLTNISGLKMLFGQTNNKLSQFSSIIVKRSSSQGINKKRPYLKIA